MKRFAVCSLLLLSVFTTALATCTSPKVSVVNSFSTQDATILTQLAHISELSFKCANNDSPNLFAEFPCGKIIPLARVGGDNYQISWTEDVKKGSSGQIVLRLFDEEGYSNVRKAQRDGEKVANIKSLVDVSITTKSAYKGPWVRAELVAASFIGIVAYFAFTTKSKVQA